MTTRLANLYAFQTEFDRHGDASSRLARFVAPFAQRIFHIAFKHIGGLRGENLDVIHSPIRRDIKLDAYRTFDTQRLGTCRIRRLVAAYRPRAARRGQGRFCRCRCGVRLRTCWRRIGRFTSRFGCSTFFSGFGLGLGFGLGSGL